ncbi:hypothetical protein PsAD2_04133 [Pseudovibrio axinellae]|uniref:Uncharacterized protein n=1 Tax=Pseudovibrio axinellae TaxID=989403 RepID=A0A165TYE2_9HYPH|nr:hypothetical protein [Pseudovibrio axinellae]KZL08464.1 hypothetical protein PsAD2_04133 [Pseudovibrio axinellae]SEP74793.1 hypothetical protein SAMN05421798_101299 [Pseudovibrio axinellae]
MISYLIDGFLLFALALTTWRVIVMYRQLKKLSGYHEDYQRIFDQTTEAMDNIGLSLQEIRVRGEEILTNLGLRIDEARETTVDISGVILQAQTEMKALQEHIEWLSKKSGEIGISMDDAPPKPGGDRGRRSGSVPRQAKVKQKSVSRSSSNAAALLLTGGLSKAAPPEKSENTAVSAIDNQNVRVRKVSFGQSATFRSVSVKDEEGPEKESDPQ